MASMYTILRNEGQVLVGCAHTEKYGNVMVEELKPTMDGERVLKYFALPLSGVIALRETVIVLWCAKCYAAIDKGELE